MQITSLPQDPVMLLGTVNLKLRDQYPSLRALCDDLSLSESDLCEKLAQIDYHYDPEHNQFR